MLGGLAALSPLSPLPLIRRRELHAPRTERCHLQRHFCCFDPICLTRRISLEVTHRCVLQYMAPIETGRPHQQIVVGESNPSVIEQRSYPPPSNGSEPPAICWWRRGESHPGLDTCTVVRITTIRHSYMRGNVLSRIFSGQNVVDHDIAFEV